MGAANDRAAASATIIADCGTGIDQRIKHRRRTQIGKQLEPAAQTDDPHLGAIVERLVVILRAADRAKQHRIGFERLGHGLLGQRLAMHIDRGAAHQPVRNLEAQAALLLEPGEHAQGFAHDLGANAVTGEDEEFLGHAGAPNEKRKESSFCEQKEAKKLY